MRIRIVVTSIAIAAAVFTSVACGRSGSSDVGKTIKSTTVGDTTVTLSSATGELKQGENSLTLSFTDPSGKAVDVPAASLKFHMPAMGSMAEMSDVAALSTTATHGKFQAVVNIESAGTWEAMISFQGPRGTEQTAMSINVK